MCYNITYIVLMDLVEIHVVGQEREAFGPTHRSISDRIKRITAKNIKIDFQSNS